MLKFHNGIDHNVGIQNLPEILEASASSSDGTNSSRKLPFWSKIFMRVFQYWSLYQHCIIVHCEKGIEKGLTF